MTEGLNDVFRCFGSPPGDSGNPDNDFIYTFGVYAPPNAPPTFMCLEQDFLNDDKRLAWDSLTPPKQSDLVTYSVLSYDFDIQGWVRNNGLMHTVSDSSFRLYSGRDEMIDFMNFMEREASRRDPSHGFEGPEKH